MKLEVARTKRLGGWLKRQLPLLRSTYANQINAIKVYPANGDSEFVAVASIEELDKCDIPLPDNNYELKQGLPLPNWLRIQVPNEAGAGTRNTTIYWGTLHKNLRLDARIISFARSIEAKHIQEALSKLGRVTGIGDKFSHGYGRFSLVNFEVKQEKLNL